MVPPKLAPLDLLLDILPTIQKISKSLETRRANQGPSQESIEFLQSLRNTVFSFSYIFKTLKTAGFETELIPYTERILRCFENTFNDSVNKLTPQEAENYSYPRLRAVRNYALDKGSHVLPEEEKIHVLQSSVLFETDEEQALITTTLTQCFEELQVRFPPENEDGHLPHKQRRQPLLTVWDSANRAYSAFSRCCGAPCAKHRDLEACLLLATYANHAEFEELCPLDLLFTFDPNSSLRQEVRIHSRLNSPNDLPKVRFVSDTRDSDHWQLKMPRRIQQICDVLGNKHRAALRLNLLLENDDNLWAHKPTQRMLALEKLGQEISLEQLISMPTKNGNEMEKLVLALILGYSLFYLYKGSWIPRVWPAKNITFFQSGNSIPLRPFLRHTVTSINPDDSESLFHQYPILVGFAVTLLQIHLGERLESYLDLDETLTNIDDQWARAQEVYTKRKQHISWPSYRNAIKACLDPGFETQEFYEGDQLRQLIYTKIIEPLEADLEHSFSPFISVKNLDEEAPKLSFSSSCCIQDQLMTNIPKAASLLSTEANDIETVPVSRQGHLPMAKSLDLQQVSLTNCTTAAYSEFPNPLAPTIKRKITMGTHVDRRVRRRTDQEDPPPQSLENPTWRTVDYSGDFRFFDDQSVPEDISLSARNAYLSWRKSVSDVYDHLIRNNFRSPPVKIAVLDTGMDQSHPDYEAWRERIGGVKSFIADGQQDDKDVYDTSGHGTHVAGLLLDYAPDAELFIAKVADLEPANPATIAKAINYAVSDWKVDIISMSFGFPSRYDHLEDGLNAARNQDVLLFAAAANNGANTNRAYPARREGVICIHSTDANGGPSGFNPRPIAGDNFATIGEAVESTWPIHLCDRNVNELGVAYKSGTSFATPIATGIAAFLLQYTRLKLSPEDAKQLKKSESMKAVLREISVKTQGYDYIAPRLHPDNFFGKDELTIQVKIKDALWNT